MKKVAPKQPRTLDHVVLPVASLEVARARYEALGFTVAPNGLHPFGTENCCIYLEDETMLEPLAMNVVLIRVFACLCVARQGCKAVKEIANAGCVQIGKGDAQLALSAGIVCGAEHRAGQTQNACVPHQFRRQIGRAELKGVLHIGKITAEA